MINQNDKPSVRRVVSLLAQLEDIILVGLFVIMCSMVVVQVILRNFLSSGIIWGDVMVRITVLWIGLVGAMVASRKGNHISIELIARYLPIRMKGMTDSICSFVTSSVKTVNATERF